MNVDTAPKGTLYGVASPIGNLVIMVPRAVESLQSVALMARGDCAAGSDRPRLRVKRCR